MTIGMPRFNDGPKAGQLCGWLSANKPPATTRKKIEHSKIRKLWRQAARDALEQHGVPQDLGRIYLLVQFQFIDRTKRDLPNHELTVKPCVDALQPDRFEDRKKKVKYGSRVVEITEKVHHIGWGVIPDDDRRWLIRGPEQDVLPPLGRGNPIGGRVIFHIIPFPATLQPTA